MCQVGTQADEKWGGVRDDKASEPPLGRCCRETEPQVPMGVAKGACERMIILMSPRWGQSPHSPFPKCLISCAQMRASILNRTPGELQKPLKGRVARAGILDHQASRQGAVGRVLVSVSQLRDPLPPGFVPFSSAHLASAWMLPDPLAHKAEGWRLPFKWWLMSLSHSELILRKRQKRQVFCSNEGHIPRRGTRGRSVPIELQL